MADIKVRYDEAIKCPQCGSTYEPHPQPSAVAIELLVTEPIRWDGLICHACQHQFTVTVFLQKTEAMTRDELIAACRAIIAADEAATGPPWTAEKSNSGTSSNDPEAFQYIAEISCSGQIGVDEVFCPPEDVNFIITARNTAPAVARAVLEMLGVEDDE